MSHGVVELMSTKARRMSILAEICFYANHDAHLHWLWPLLESKSGSCTRVYTSRAALAALCLPHTKSYDSDTGSTRCTRRFAYTMHTHTCGRTKRANAMPMRRIYSLNHSGFCARPTRQTDTSADKKRKFADRIARVVRSHSIMLLIAVCTLLFLRPDQSMLRAERFLLNSLLG